MALIDQTGSNYYNSGDFGGYQFTSLYDLINAFLVVYVGEDKLIDKASRVDVQFVDYDPYPSEVEMCQDAMKNRVLKIWTGGTEHPVFDPELNAKMRAVLDYMTHCQRDTNFTLPGEIAAFNGHMKTVPEAAREALFTEVVGQAAYFINYGEFPEQKIVKLKGFDK